MMLVVRVQKFIHVSSFVFHSVFLCQLHAHTYAIKNVLAEIVFLWFSKKYSVYIIVTMMMFVTSQSFIPLPSFSAAVSEIHNLNQNKKKFENSNFQFTTFPRHITDPFLMRVTF